MLRRSMMARCPVVAPVLVEAPTPTSRLVTLQREASLNALNVPMVKLLRDEYIKLSQLPSQSTVVVMVGAGSKAFCAGGDVVAIVKDEPKGCRQTFFYEEYQADYLVATLKQPHVALWQGIVMGGGVGISIHGSHRVACENTLFAMPETGIGLFPDVGGSWTLSRLPHDGLGMYLALTGARLKGADVVHAGLATHFVPAASFSTLQKKLLTEVKPTEVSNAIESFVDSKPKPFSLESRLHDISRVFGSKAESVEHIIDSLKSTDDDWSTGVVKTLEKMSPSSLKVSFECQRRAARHISIKDTFEMEYCVSQRFMDTTDFNRGVTALLIDKSGARPKWDPEELSLVTADLIEAHFAPPSKAPLWHPEKPFQRSDATAKL